MAGGQGCYCCIVCCILVVLLPVLLLLILAYGVVVPVRVTAEDAILTRLDLAGANGTGLAYSILLTR
uniref:Late embryogenesis abundant protein LEA-2 subgroup domain-containing protein n=1 Tax=Oryza glumipatula TaxID=40148 RepID=A0A0D9ZGF9_9ORYZ